MIFFDAREENQKWIPNSEIKKKYTYILKSVKSSKLYPLIRWWVSTANTVLPSFL